MLSLIGCDSRGLAVVFDIYFLLDLNEDWQIASCSMLMSKLSLSLVTSSKSKFYLEFSLVFRLKTPPRVSLSKLLEITLWIWMVGSFSELCYFFRRLKVPTTAPVVIYLAKLVYVASLKFIKLLWVLSFRFSSSDA